MAIDAEMAVALWTMFRDRDFLRQSHTTLDPELVPRGASRYLVALAKTYWQDHKAILDPQAMDIVMNAEDAQRYGTTYEAAVDVYVEVYGRFEFNESDLPVFRQAATKWFRSLSLSQRIDEASEALEAGDLPGADKALRDGQRVFTPLQRGLNLRDDLRNTLAKQWPPSCPTGFEVLDKAWAGGSHLGMLGVVIAPWNTGKSMLLPWFAGQALKANKNVLYYCVAPDTRIQRADLSWSAARDLQIGDKVISFDEEPTSQHGRKMCISTVQANVTRILPCFDVYLTDGTKIRATGEHRWLVQSAGNPVLHWWRTDRLVAGMHTLSRIMSPPTESYDTRGAGLLAGAFDSEGCYGARGLTLTFAQKDNALLADVKHELRSLGFLFAVYLAGKSGVLQLRLQGGVHEQWRFLSLVRPSRLLAKLEQHLNNFPLRVRVKERVGIERVVYVGDQEIAALSTGTATYIAEGFGAHNTTELDENTVLKRVASSITHKPINDMDADKASEGLRRIFTLRAGMATAEDDNAAMPWFEVMYRDALTLSVKDIESDLDMLAEEGHRIHLVILDGDDIRCDRKFDSPYDMYLYIYTDLSTLAQHRQIAIWTAAQGTRDSSKAQLVQGHHIADSIAKIRKADLALTMQHREHDLNEEGRPEMVFNVAKDRFFGTRDKRFRARMYFGEGLNGYAAFGPVEDWWNPKKKEGDSAG